MSQEINPRYECVFNKHAQDKYPRRVIKLDLNRDVPYGINSKQVADNTFIVTYFKHYVKNNECGNKLIIRYFDEYGNLKGVEGITLGKHYSASLIREDGVFIMESTYRTRLLRKNRDGIQTMVNMSNDVFNKLFDLSKEGVIKEFMDFYNF